MQKPDVELGYMRLKVDEVARNKVMKDTWPLKSAVKGDIQLTLAFQPIIFEDAAEVCCRIQAATLNTAAVKGDIELVIIFQETQSQGEGNVMMRNVMMALVRVHVVLICCQGSVDYTRSST